MSFPLITHSKELNFQYTKFLVHQAKVIFNLGWGLWNIYFQKEREEYSGGSYCECWPFKLSHWCSTIQYLNSVFMANKKVKNTLTWNNIYAVLNVVFSLYMLGWKCIFYFEGAATFFCEMCNVNERINRSAYIVCHIFLIL